MAMSYEYYKIFYYVGKCQSISGAAKELNNSQPNISRAMKNLESELGCRLLERSHTGVKLTEDGEILFKHIEFAEKHFETARAALENRRHPQKRKLFLGFSIGISEMLLFNVILPVVANFMEKHNDISIRIINDSTLDLITGVEEGVIDLAVITDSGAGTERGKEWISFQDILIAGGGYKDLKDKKLSLSDLIKYPIICPRPGTETFRFYYSFFSSEGLLFEPDIETASADQVLHFVENGMGLGFVADGIAYEAIRNGSVVKVGIKEDIPRRRVSILHNRNRNLSQEIEELESMLLEISSDKLKKKKEKE